MKDGIDATAEWLNYVRPEGLVVTANVLRERIGEVPLQTAADTEEFAEAVGIDLDAERRRRRDGDAEPDAEFVLSDPWRLFADVLRWPVRLVAGAHGGPDLPPIETHLAEHQTTLRPDWAVLWNGAADDDLPAQALVMLHPTIPADERHALDGWEGSPHQRLERLLRETGVGVGILVARGVLRLVYAPRGETSGYIDWPLAALARVEGRPMLAGLKVCLNSFRFFQGDREQHLRALLKASREAQNEVSEKLSEQVLGALHELLRGLHSADPARIENLAVDDPHHLYEGLLTCLMRLVFLLYAEDRDLLPTATDGRSRALYESGYSVKTLYARLTTDVALNPDTMDMRYGGWGQLLALFRLVHGGHRSWIKGRGGKLFDPDAFPFIEGRDRGSTREDAEVLAVSDGCLLRILHGLVTVETRVDGRAVRETISYKGLDVEQIGSVYETVMGFAAARATEPMIALRDDKKLPTFVGLRTLLKLDGSKRQKALKDGGVKPTAKQLNAVAAAESIDDLVAAFALGRTDDMRIGLIDRRGSPHGTVLAEGTPYLYPTDERRRSGSHYTPRSLTEPIVRHALEPAFERIGEEAAAEAVLSLKVCDPACGSGAFLVEACRQLGTRLEKAWAFHPHEKPPIPLDEDEALHARRLVAQRCLYGVDKNPMAVDLARLSLWLATLAREHEFTFLDHALKAGDSLVGLSRRAIEAAHWDASKGVLPLLRQLFKERLDRVHEGREAIRTAPDDVERALQEAKYARVEKELEPLRMVGDAVVASYFAADKAKGRETARQDVESWLQGMAPQWEHIGERGHAFCSEVEWRPFHWEIEFPEVFNRDNPGFDAIVGNPPFLGGRSISTNHSSSYRDWISFTHEGTPSSADLVAHFFRRAFDMLRARAAFGLIATNTIRQGDTRQGGRAQILKEGAVVARAATRVVWPLPSATVVVSIVHASKGANASKAVLNGKPVRRISAFLVDSEVDNDPLRLVANTGSVFQGAIILGMGFTFDDVNEAKGSATALSEMERIIEENSKNRKIVKPYLGGEELVNDPSHQHRRYAIDFGDIPLCRKESASQWLKSTDSCSGVVAPTEHNGPVASDWPELLEIVRQKVQPERLSSKNLDVRRYPWWKYWRPRPELGQISLTRENILAVCAVSPYLSVARIGAKQIFAHSLFLFNFDQYSVFAALQSRIHEVWARFFSSSMKDDLRYAPSDCFETFPFPPGYEIDTALEEAGRTYHDHRAALMVEANEGMTKTYNRFHKSEETSAPIARLRELHDAMDRAVLTAYGWHDLAASVSPTFLTEETEDDHTYQYRYFWPSDVRDEVLARLLKLNAERHAEEVAAKKQAKALAGE